MRTKLLYFLLIILLLEGCATRYQKPIVIISFISNRKIFVSNLKDSLKIDSLNKESILFEKKCNKEKVQYIIDPQELDAEFKGGIFRFREMLGERFKINKNYAYGENKVKVVIGNNNHIESFKILKFSDNESKKQIIEMLNSVDFNKWESAKLYNIRVKESFEFSIYIADNRKKRK